MHSCKSKSQQHKQRCRWPFSRSPENTRWFSVYKCSALRGLFCVLYVWGSGFRTDFNSWLLQDRWGQATSRERLWEGMSQILPINILFLAASISTLDMFCLCLHLIVISVSHCKSFENTDMYAIFLASEPGIHPINSWPPPRPTPQLDRISAQLSKGFKGNYF